MDISETEVKVIVERILKQIQNNQEIVEQEPLTQQGNRGLFPTIESAIDAAEKAFYQLHQLTLDHRKEMIRQIRKIVMSNQDSLSKMAVEETGFGRVEDKIEKHKLVALKTPGVEDLEPIAYTDDHGMTLVERAPYGVIGAIIPSTNPTTSVVNNAISMIAGGNTVVFHPHPNAKKCSCTVISLINQAIIDAGGPENVITAIQNPTLETAQTMMKHPKIRLLVVTGGPAVVRVAMNSGKKVIAAGPGNPPCVVDETADILKAGRDIVRGAGFDNNIICICEKEILAVSSIADRLKEEIKKNGAYELNKSQIDKITPIIIDKPGAPGQEGAPNKKFVGKNANLIAKEIGLNLPDDIRLLLCEVESNHPLVWTEQLMPVMPFVRFNSVEEAIQFAVQCEHGFRHTAIMHSKNVANLSAMAKLMDCSIFIKNGPSYCGLGFEGAGFTSFTIASPTGEGLTRPRTFTRERRCTLVDYFRIV
ncbi:aldehyde dehydrogenase family protein [Atribacter laminatus]|jgi:acyl-CoA reductase-like NAD-dependent aldehyde dehydrogenase|uniref:Aldehyde-alcohol dehydrogenase n=1 Tax=Atribacter laminatus TaxID=2847778 RepID=A0A7T1AK54_ATRLM|nr:aldehyde dehydrogenase family protein [Atribacter laminatus]QPM67417.1 Aldehyde-alcohol dehydrogenase [Atribacter laminatus]